MAVEFSFIHTSNLHLNMENPEMGDFSGRLKDSLLEVFDLIISLTRREKVDALFIAGDLFEAKTVSGETLNYIREKFESLKPVNIFISPGSSDPITEDSPYLRLQWPENVYVFKKNEFTTHLLEEKKVAIHGFAHTSEDFQENPLEGYKVGNEDYFNLLFFNGSITDVGYPDQKITAPFRFHNILESGADYVALGHFHRVQSLKRKGEKTIQGCYPGSPQGTRFTDEGEKGILKVVISGNRKDITFLPTARIKFNNINLNCGDMSNKDDIVNCLKSIIQEKNLAKNPTQITLKGKIEKELVLDIEKLRQEVGKDCLYLEIKNKTRHEYDPQEFKDERTVRGFFAKKTLGRIEATPQDDEKNREILQLALKYGLDSFSGKEVKKRW
ncbi:MAG: DNA repair exonuclease [Candidatus Eremiobacteraeota bacterium]|nr:DNA repair exonuclease [Candidatus Eremiobacteraeota bacterium]